jgi:hypothetical protein
VIDAAGSPERVLADALAALEDLPLGPREREPGRHD